ncbi:MAG: methionyl-tRNA formyltransferase [Terriglobales bacterium]
MIDRVRIVFMGTPDFAVPSLHNLVREAPGRGWQVVGVVCQPDRPVGRGGRVQAPPVRRAAMELGIEVYQPERMRDAEAQEWLRGHRPDALAVVAFGQILPQAVFNLPRFGAINAHASLLPAYRGAAPIQWAIANGERETGVTTMQIDAGLDTGAMLLRRSVAIGPETTAPELSGRLALVAAELMVQTLTQIERGGLHPVPQPDAGSSLAPRLQRRDGVVDWASSAVQIYNRWRGFQPWPGLHTQFRGQQLALLRCHAEPGGPQGEPGTLVEIAGTPVVICGCGVLWLEEVRAEGRQALSGADFARGARIRWGHEQLGGHQRPDAKRRPGWVGAPGPPPSEA